MGVQFEEDNFSQRDFGGQSVPKLAKWLIEHRLAKDEAAADRLQVLATCVFFALAIYFFFH